MEQEQIVCKKNSANNELDIKSVIETLGQEVLLDLSQHNLRTFSECLFSKCPNIQYLYLEGNQLMELSPSLFPTLRQLRWLDVRNNKLASIPSSIQDHPSLQTLLLEGNNITALPVEIGSIMSLQGIQLGRNPLQYPPQNIVNLGVPATLQFLRRQWQQLQSPQHIQLSHSLPKSASPKGKSSGKKQLLCKSAGALQDSSVRGRGVRKARSSLGVGLSTCISVRPISQGRPEAQDTTDHHWPITGCDEFYQPIMNYERKASVQDHLQRKTHNSKGKRKPSDEVQPKFLRDLWLEKIRQMLIAQETILQRRKNEEALKEWQDETRHQQETEPKKDCGGDINFPYDTDPQLKMMSRKDLGKDVDKRRRDSSLHHVRHEEPINSKILWIMTALQELQTSRSTACPSPRTEQKLLAQDIKKIKEIQRSLSSLKLTNFGQLAL